jgi:hypothetical protein
MQRDRRREQGVVMFITVLLLAMMGGLGLAALDSAARDRDTAGYYNRETAAFYAADAGVQHARALVKKVASPSDVPDFPTEAAPQSIGDTSAYYNFISAGGSLPTYYGDPSAPATFELKDTSIAEGESFGGKSKRTVMLWKIHVVGQSPSGERARIQAMEAKLFTEGY